MARNKGVSDGRACLSALAYSLMRWSGRSGGCSLDAAGPAQGLADEPPHPGGASRVYRGGGALIRVAFHLILERISYTESPENGDATYSDGTAPSQ